MRAYALTVVSIAWTSVLIRLVVVAIPGALRPPTVAGPLAGTELAVVW